MGLGTQIRLSRLCWHPSGNLFGIAVNHFLGCGNVREDGLANLPESVNRFVTARRDTMTMTPGAAKSCWSAHACKAAPYELLVLAHIHPRDYSDGVKIVSTSGEIDDAVRVGIETGVDVINVGYPGDELTFAEIIDACPGSVVMAGGPREPAMKGALEHMVVGMRAGARAPWSDAAFEESGTWSGPRAYAAVIHDGVSADEAVQRA